MPGEHLVIVEWNEVLSQVRDVVQRRLDRSGWERRQVLRVENLRMIDDAQPRVLRDKTRHLLIGNEEDVAINAPEFFHRAKQKQQIVIISIPALTIWKG